MGVRSEIEEQPEVCRRLLTEGRAEAEALAAELARAAPAFLVVAARGSSDNAARYAQHLFGVRHRLTVALASPSLLTLYAAPPSLRGGAVLAVSQSGQSPDIVAVLADARRQNVPALVVTNDAGSPLAAAASAVIDLRAGPEKGVAATKTYTAELVALAMVSAALAGDPGAWRELDAIPDALAATLASPVPSLAGDGLVVLGRGFNHATAHEIALKIKETSYLPAEAFSFADFEHGPIAMLDAGDPALVVAPSGRVDATAILDLLARRGARTAVISDRPDFLARAAVPLPLPPGVPEWLSPIVSVIPGQRLALAIADARGIDPDAPRGLAKITRTH